MFSGLETQYSQDAFIKDSCVQTPTMVPKHTSLKGGGGGNRQLTGFIIPVSALGLAFFGGGQFFKKGPNKKRLDVRLLQTAFSSKLVYQPPSNVHHAKLLKKLV